MIRVLTIDDESAIQRLLQSILSRGGFEAVAARDGRTALAELGRGHVDAVILDLGLPDRDGLELIGAIRAATDAPILVLTVRSDIAEKIAALDLGADDYLTKPFDGDELLARLRSALRRSRGGEGAVETVSHGSIVVDLARHEVTVAGAPVSLTPREFAVLRALVQAGGRILTHAALLERVWGKAHVTDVDYVRVMIRALRLKIEVDPSIPKLILNEPGIGYRLAG